jgi:imidazolonepropionase-like amidohydrolase
MPIRHALAALLVTSLLAGGAGAQSSTVAFTNARIIPIGAPELERGTLLISEGRIAAVGPAASVQVPPGAQRIDLGGKVLMPGLVDTHSHIGGVAGADGSAPIQPDVRVLDAFDVRSSSIRRAQAGGITSSCAAARRLTTS